MSTDHSEDQPETRQNLDQGSSMALQATVLGFIVIGLFLFVLFVPMSRQSLWLTLLVGSLLSLAGIVVLTRHLGNTLKQAAIIYAAYLLITACFGVLYFSQINVPNVVLKWLALPLAYPILIALLGTTPLVTAVPRNKVFIALFFEVVIYASGAYTIAILWGWL